MTSNAIHALIALLVFSFSAFLLFITRPVGGGLDTSAVALCGPLLGAVGAYYFQSAAAGQGASISAAGVTAALASAAGQPTSIQSGSSSFKTGSAAESARSAAPAGLVGQSVNGVVR